MFESWQVGCIPVVIVFPSDQNSGNSWTDIFGPQHEQLLPFGPEIDVEEGVVLVPYEVVLSGKILDYLIDFPSHIILKKFEFVVSVIQPAISYSMRIDLNSSTLEIFEEFGDAENFVIKSIIRRLPNFEKSRFVEFSQNFAEIDINVARSAFLPFLSRFS